MGWPSHFFSWINKIPTIISLLLGLLDHTEILGYSRDLNSTSIGPYSPPIIKLKIREGARSEQFYLYLFYYFQSLLKFILLFKSLVFL